MCVWFCVFACILSVQKDQKKSILHFSGTSIMSDSKSSFEFLELNPGPQ